LCADFNGLISKEMPAHFDAALHQYFSGTGTTRRRRRHHPANGYIIVVCKSFGQQTGVADEFPESIATHQVPRILILAVRIQIGAVLFHYKYFLAQSHDGIQFVRGQLVERQTGKSQHPVFDIDEMLFFMDAKILSPTESYRPVRSIEQPTIILPLPTIFPIKCFDTKFLKT